MTETVYNLYEAKNTLSRLVERAAQGENIIIAKAGKPMVRLVAVTVPVKPRKPGGWEGKMTIADDFDEPLPKDIQDAFEGYS
jgi:prevent-host-death family protein